MLCDLAADEQRELNVEDRVGEVGQRVRAVLEHVRGDQLVDGADGGPERVRRNRGNLGDVLARPPVDVLELRREAVLDRGAAVAGLGAGAENPIRKALANSGLAASASRYAPTAARWAASQSGASASSASSMVASRSSTMAS